MRTATMPPNARASSTDSFADCAARDSSCQRTRSTRSEASKQVGCNQEREKTAPLSSVRSIRTSVQTSEASPRASITASAV